MDLEDASKFFRNQQPRRRFFNVCSVFTVTWRVPAATTVFSLPLLFCFYCVQVSIPTVLQTASGLSISEAQLERLSLEFKQQEVDQQIQLPLRSPSRTLRASKSDIAKYKQMENTALEDAEALRQKV